MVMDHLKGTNHVAMVINRKAVLEGFMFYELIEQIAFK